MLDLLRDFLRLTGGALGLYRQVFLATGADPRALPAGFVLAFAAGVSLTLGQSVVLFANRSVSAIVGELLGDRPAAETPERASGG